MSFEINKILVPTDFSDFSLNSLKYAGFFAKHAKAEIILLHVTETYLQNVNLEAIIDLDAAIHEAIKKKLNQMIAENSTLWGVRITPMVVKGKIHDVMQKVVADEDIDLVVMGTHGVSNTDSRGRKILGSNSYKAVNGIIPPVMTIRDTTRQVEFKNIVLPIDTTKDTKQKVSSAIKIAKVTGATVHLVSVITYMASFRTDEIVYKKLLNQVADQIFKEGIEVKTKVIMNDDISDSIIKYSDKVAADLIMIMTTQESNLNSVFLGSHARSIITGSYIPVMTFKPE